MMKTVPIWGLRVPIWGFLHWLLFVLVYLIAIVVTAIITPILPAFATKENRLPEWLSWFSTPDSDLDGDKGWKNQHSKWLEVFPLWSQQYLKRVFWLYRNPLYGFTTNVLGAPKDKVYQPLIEGTGFDRKGTYKRHYWMVYFMRDDLAKKRRFKVYIGWKLKTEDLDRYQFVFLINPFQTP